MKLLLLLSLSSIFISNAWAQNGRYLAYLGGSGDPPGDSTIFDAKIRPLNSFIQSAERHAPVNVEVAFDGGHRFTETLLRENFSDRSVRQFNSVSYEGIISDYERKINSGSIKSGDQIMLMIDTHGSQPLPNAKTHTIAAGQRQISSLLSFSGNGSVSLDRLENLSRLAEAKGIKLAILDFSCHSGATISLGNSKTCVIAASGPMSFAYGGASPSTFSNSFVNKLLPGRNLEDIYLQARSASNDMGFPMISTSEGKNAQNILYPALMKYLNAHELTSDKFAPEIEKSVATNSCESEPQEVEALLKLSRDLEEGQVGLNLSDFRHALTVYADYRRTIQTRLKAGNSETVSVCGINNQCTNVKISELLAMNPEQMITQYQAELSRTWNPAAKERVRNLLAYHHNAKRIRDDYLRANPQGGKFQELLKTFPEITRKTMALAQDVAIESRKMYSSLYLAGQINPCKDFVL